MHSTTRPRRLARLAACTALALSAGALLTAGPAAAVDGRADRTAVSDAAAQPSLTLPARADHAAAGYATAAAAAKPRLDLDGDGRPDWVWRGVWGFCGTFLSGSSSNKSTEFTIYHDTLETVKNIIPVGNAGGSSRPELLTLSFDGRLSLHPTTTKGAGAPTWSGYGWTAYNRVVSAADLNRDGRPDLLARTPSGDLYLYKGTGNLQDPFAPRIKVGPGWGGYDQLVGAGDLDRDGVADVLARTVDGVLYYYKGTGSATKPFKSRVKVGPGWNAYNQIIAADDVDRDGKTDIMARAFNGKIYWYFSTGNGHFTPRYDAGSNWQDVEFMFGSGITPVLGRHSLQARDGAGKIYEYVGQTDGNFFPRTETKYAPIEAGASMISASGLDKFNWATAVQVKGDGTAKLPYPSGDSPLTGLRAGAKPVAGPADLTGDGRGDLLSRDAAGVLWLNPGTGSRTAFKTAVKVGGGWGVYKNLVGGGDVTGDGRPDLIARGTDVLYVYPGTGSASKPFGTRFKVGAGWKQYDQLASPGDLNGDGRADLVARDSAGKLWRYVATGKRGSSTFSARGLIGGGWNMYAGLS
ncbi:VCBS repeat-containing protein [Streptomyces sp. NPDC089919]|uniref:FG-GAP repeat domain-containing protein n=1 Tax=Streptomyces sp. NPDC089919 TaxID=3155188 RepID=UPI003445A008